jgi:hypothetical protein
MVVARAYPGVARVALCPNFLAILKQMSDPALPNLWKLGGL